MKTKHVRLLSLTLLLAACASPAASLTLPTASPLPMATETSAPVGTATAVPTLADTSTPMPFELTSPAFENDGVIPNEYSCKGEDGSPELVWGEPPAGAQSFAIIFDDPDAGGGGWVHWVAYNIPPDARGLPAGVADGEQFAGGGLHGANSWGTMDYRGPCPPQGSTHRYVFKLYALDAMPNLDPGASKRELLAAMEGHIVAEVELAANFTR